MKKNVLGIKIDDINIDQATNVVVSWLKTSTKHYIVTTNPETIVMAQKDQELKKIVNNADLSIPDGVGLRLVTDIECLSPGIDLMEELISRSLDYGFTIGFLGGNDGVAEKATECLMRKYPNLKISFVSDGGIIDENGERIRQVGSSKYYVLREYTGKSKNTHTTNYILPATDILFVAFGQPKQEKWIAKNLPNIPVKVAMGIGGGLDYLSGQVPRAPKLLRRFGFEWLFRLILQPWRIKRQLALLEYLRLIMLS